MPHTRSISQINAVRYVRPMLGHSQSSLVQCDDGHYYVLKQAGNPEGPNVLANELVGSVLAEAAGLPTPPVAYIRTSREFFGGSTQRLTGRHNMSYCSESGIHFGSRYVGGMVKPMRGVRYVPERQIHRVTQHSAFLGMYLLDLWADHQEDRQTVFAYSKDYAALEPHFIDNGLMFGGAHWSFRDWNAPRRPSSTSLYHQWWTGFMLVSWTNVLRQSIPNALHQVLPSIPSEWYSGSISWLEEALLARLEHLASCVDLDDLLLQIPTTYKN